LLTGDPVDRAFIEGIVEIVVNGIAQPRGCRIERERGLTGYCGPLRRLKLGASSAALAARQPAGGRHYGQAYHVAFGDLRERGRSSGESITAHRLLGRVRRKSLS
jgi:hypothetical protein